MKKYIKMTWMETKLFLRDPLCTFFTMAFPLMYLFLFGFISGNEPTPMYGGRNMIEAVIPNLTAMIISMMGLTFITVTMATYREKGILRRLRTTPVSPLVLLVAQLVVVFAMTCLGMLLLVAAGKIFYNIAIQVNVFNVLAGFVLSSLCFFGIGFVLAGILPSARTAQIVGMVLLYPMILLSGAFFSLDLLPEGVQKVANYLPLTYVVNLLNGLWYGEPWRDHWLNVVVLSSILVLSVIVSIKAFQWE
jgi:ABC-2 type transport system permease protein